MDRRTFMQAGGALVVSFAVPVSARAQAASAGKTLAKDMVDAWLAIGRDGSVTVYTGKVDLGTGVRTALAQMVAEELDVPFGRVSLVMGDTALTPDQGQTASSVSIQSAGVELRQAAATARKALVERAATKLGAPATGLRVEDGVVLAPGGQRVSYGELVGDQRFELKVDAKAPVKKPIDYRIVGKSVPRVDIPAKVTGAFTYMQDFRLPDMLHARVIRPTAIGAKLESVDEASVRGVPGFVQLVRKQDFLAVLAKTEWGAIQAARSLKATWSGGGGLPEQAKLYAAVRATPVAREEVPVRVGDAKKALSAAGKVVRATYEYPINTHGSIGPACAVAQVQDGRLTVWSPSQATHSLQSELTTVVGMPKDRIRLVYLEGSGCYGRNGHEDCTAEAALIATLTGKTVRVQWSREDEHGWDPKSPPLVVDMSGAVDGNGFISAWHGEFFMPMHTGSLDDFPLLPAVASGVPRRGPYTGSIQQNAPSPYAVPNALVEVHRLKDTPLRPSHLRTPGRMQNTYANESFMDELAAAARQDPLLFRMKHLSGERAMAVMNGVARLSNWESRPSPAPGAGKGRVMKGRGVAYVRYEGNRTYVAATAEVEVHRDTGKVRVTRVCVSHDCGLVVNPDGARNQIEGGVIQTVSRTLIEEVTFDRQRVTSTDWASHPILRFPDVPEVVIDLIHRPNERPWGVGEPVAAVVPSAIASAIHDATGVRLRTVPFTPARVLAALKSNARAA
jgi:nicotinate dehydrogenase subunit B